MKDILHLPSPLHQIENELTKQFNIHLYVKRDDLIHEAISGNKWRKLKYNIQYAQQNNKEIILTFGGAYSNHITATAKACQLFGLKSVGLIRGEAHEPLNKSLQFAKDCGMDLIYVDRENYRRKNDEDAIQNTQYINQREHIYVVPEGGSNTLALKGCAEIVDEITNENKQDFDFICCACGTGTTITGVASNLKKHQQAIGFSVLKGIDFLSNELIKQQNHHTLNRLSFNPNYHFGGYAKTNAILIDFIKVFYQEHHILLDYVYTGKMMFGVLDLIQQGKFAKGSRIICIHTGGVMNANIFEK
jgi:1-aminocyclopropane-1-carboxylate deaminase/D-cysteine desulfhydrase-like pyridoxal-dependent ACC family enzyme